MFSVSVTPTAPGWYADAREPESLRWWDGRAWTDQRRLRPGLPSSRRGAIRRARVVQQFALR